MEDTHFDGAEGLEGELALGVELDGVRDEARGLVDVALPLQLQQAAVHEGRGVGRVALHGPAEVVVGLLELLLVAQHLGVEEVALGALREALDGALEAQHGLLHQGRIADGVGAPVVRVEFLHQRDGEVAVAAHRTLKVGHGQLRLVQQHVHLSDIIVLRQSQQLPRPPSSRKSSVPVKEVTR